MTNDDEAVLAAVKRFYDGIEQMISGRGLETMYDSWHHTPQVTSSHPMGEWAFGWDQIRATWDVFSTIGKPENAGSKVSDIRVFRYGDIAYTTSIFTASPSFGGGRLNCTNILHRVDGVWKLVHHHPDKAPVMEDKMEQMATDG